MCYIRKIQKNTKKKLKIPHILSSPIYHMMLKIIFQHFQSFFLSIRIIKLIYEKKILKLS